MTESGILSSQFKLHFINEHTKAKYIVSLKKGDHYDIGFKKKDQAGSRAFDDVIGKLVVLRLPEGVYSLKKWSTAENKKIGSSSLNYLLNKKFRAMNSRSLYLGNLHLLNSEKQSSFFVMDNRIRDLNIFYKRYPQVNKNKLLIASKAFLDPASGRDRVFDAYTNCRLKGYSLFSKKRLPAHLEKFRTLRVNSEDKKVSRIDGYRLKFKNDFGMPRLDIKVELSAAKDYMTDKKVIEEWFDGVSKKINSFDVRSVKKGFFTEYQLKTNSLSDRSMIYMVTMLDDASQIITNMKFVNQAEHIRLYKTVESFMPDGMAVVDAYQQCVVKRLNQHL